MSNSSSESASPDDRLESWKAIASYLKRDVTTVQRWEKREGMPVHRHVHEKAGSVYASRSELDVWARGRSLESVDRTQNTDDDPDTVGLDDRSPMPPATSRTDASGRSARLWETVLILLGSVACIAALVYWQIHSRDARWTNLLANGRFTRVSALEGSEQAVAISRDGRFVAFLANSDGRVDVWMTQVGTGQLHNLTNGSNSELVNPSVRVLGFSPKGDLVTFWTRASGNPASIGVWAVPILGGVPRPYLEGAAELDWSADGSRLVYHTTGPGDPMFVKGTADPAPRQIFAAPAGHHSHFPVWSPDRKYIYFVQGLAPDRSDIWRIGSTGGAPERITHHESQVSHPVFVEGTTLAYLATDADGAGPWMYTVDVNSRVPRRVSPGIDRYTSLAVSADGTRLVATRGSTRAGLWRMRVEEGAASSATRIAVNTADAAAPRLGPGFLLYVSGDGEGDSLWKQHGDRSMRLWAEDGARLTGAPVLDADGRRVAFAVRRQTQTALLVVNTDGAGLRTVATGFEWQGAPAWSPDGRSLTMAALEGNLPRLWLVPMDGSPPRRFGPAPARDPVWSPDGGFLVYSGADIGTVFPVQALDSNESVHPLPPLALSRGSRHVRFMPGRNALLMLKGGLRHKDVWATDLSSGTERQLTSLRADVEIRDFDISPDGGELVLERVESNAEVVLIDLPR